MENSFGSIKNKAMLWDTLYKNNTFTNIDQIRVAEIQTIFENIINEVGQNKEDNLLNLNKQALSLFVKRINQDKVIPSPKIDTRAKDRIDAFNKDVIKKKVEFDLHSHPKIPTGIDFRDKYTDSDTDFELKLSEMIKSREKLNHTIQFPKIEEGLGSKKIKLFQKCDIPVEDIEIIETKTQAEVYDMIAKSYELINTEMSNLRLLIDSII